MEKLDLKTPNFTNGNIEKIAELFPNCVTESKSESGELERSIDFDALRQELSDSIVEGSQERYSLNWPGKREALVTANTPISKTLRPCRDESVDFDNTKNIFIEGDNLDALKLLQETYLSKIKMIYIDPPYNTGNDFIYNDNFTADKDEYDVDSGQRDEEGGRLVANPDSNGRYHSDWLSMIYPRLKLARNLLRDDGVIFISIDDNEQVNLKRLCDEVFGEDNFEGIFTINSTPNARDYGHIGKMHEYVIFYSKNTQLAKTNLIPDTDKKFSYIDDIGGFNIHPLYNSNVAFHSNNRPNLYYPFYLNPSDKTEDGFYKIGLSKIDGRVEIYPPLSQREGIQFVWRWGKEKSLKNMNSEIVGYKTSAGEYRIVQKMRHSAKLIRSLLSETCYSTRRGTAEVESIFQKKVFSFPKPLDLLKILVTSGTSSDEIILDMFAGSGTVANAIFKLNSEDQGSRKCISIQLPELVSDTSEAFIAGYKTIAEISKERIRRAGKKIKEDFLKKGRADKEGIENLDTGFRVFKIDSSNMVDVHVSPDEASPELFDTHVGNIKKDRSSEDLLFQVLLDWGVDLSLSIIREEIAGKEVFFVDGNALAACFDKGINEEFVTELAIRKPLRVVFRDDGFGSGADGDSVKINVEQVFTLKSPATDIKVI